jgi:hypothetical protein
MLPIIVLMFVNLVFMMRSYIKGDPKEQEQRRVAKRHQGIRALEADLGMEPLDLDWPEGMVEEMRRQRRTD